MPILNLDGIRLLNNGYYNYGPVGAEVGAKVVDDGDSDNTINTIPTIPIKQHKRNNSLSESKTAPAGLNTPLDQPNIIPKTTLITVIDIPEFNI